MRSVRPAGLTRTFSVLMGLSAVSYVLSRVTGMEWMVALVSGLVATLRLSAVLPVLAHRLMLAGGPDMVAGAGVVSEVLASVPVPPRT